MHHRATPLLSTILAAVLIGTGCTETTAPEAPAATAQEVLLERSSTADAAQPGNQSIVDIAIAVNEDTGEFSTLIAALTAAGLVDALSANTQYTVFAPTDEAFADIGLNAGNIGGLDEEFLTDVLLYHVTNGRRISQSLLRARQLTMLNGDRAYLSFDGETLKIDGASVVGADISASNGVIHIVDTVLLP